MYMQLGEDHLAHVAYASRIARWGAACPSVVPADGRVFWQPWNVLHG